MRRITSILSALVLTSSVALAQQAPQGGQQPPQGGQGQTPQAPQGQQTPRPGQNREFSPVGLPGSTGANIMLVVTISDSLTADVQNKKTVTMLVADGRSGQVRSTAQEGGVINIDARPSIQRDGRIYLQLTVEYRPELTSQQLQQANTGRLTTFTESLSLLVSDGRTVTASQSSEPRSDRKVSVEVTATTVK